MPEDPKPITHLRISSIHDPRYRKVVDVVVQARKQAGLSQATLAEKVGFTQPDISKVERCERRVDILELLDMVHAISDGNQKIRSEIWKRIDECYAEPRKSSYRLD